jgi:hypothetical protein
MGGSASSSDLFSGPDACDREGLSLSERANDRPSLDSFEAPLGHFQEYLTVFFLAFLKNCPESGIEPRTFLQLV